MDDNEIVKKDYIRIWEDQDSEIKYLKRNKSKKKYSKNKPSKNNYSIFLIIVTINIIICCVLLFISSLNEENTNINALNYNNPNITVNTTEKSKTDQINNITNTSEINKTKQINNTTNTNEIKIERVNSKNSKNDTIINPLKNNSKITIVFEYSSLFANGIARFITVTANYLIETGKYDIYLITGNKYAKDYKYNPKIKRVIAHNNQTLIKNFTKYVSVDFFILQNVLGRGTVKFYKSISKKVIGMFHGVYMSAMFHGYVSSYKNWIEFDYFDAYIFISYDDYFFYKKLGFKNEIFIPNLYTFEPSKILSSNLTNHNILMLGRAADKVKGFLYAVKTMPHIIKEVPDAKLIIGSSNYKIDFLKELAVQLNVSNNIVFNHYIENISEVLWNSSVFMYTSLSEAFPMAMNEAKAYGLPIVAFDVQYSIPYQSGVINVDMLDCQALANETVKLLKDYEYRKQMGEKAKLSLNQFKNNETVELWGRLFNSLLEGEEAYRKLQYEIENKYYNEERARKHMEKHYEDLLRYNKNFTCHSINNFTDINYIKKIEMCPFNITNHTNLSNIIVNTSKKIN